MSPAPSEGGISDPRERCFELRLHRPGEEAKGKSLCPSIHIDDEFSKA